MKGLDVGAENLQAAESRIRDADMAARDGGVHQERHPHAVGHGHAGAGQHEAADGLAAAPVEEYIGRWVAAAAHHRAPRDGAPAHGETV